MNLINIEQLDDYEIEMVATFLDFQEYYPQYITPNEDITTWYSEAWEDYRWEWFQHIFSQMEEDYASEFYYKSHDELSDVEAENILWMVYDGINGNDDFWGKIINAVINSNCFIRMINEGSGSGVSYYNSPLQEVW